MKRDEAKRLIQETFENPFDRARFARFASELFNTLEPTPTTRQAGNQLPDAYKDRVQSMERIGKYVDPEGMSIDVLVVKLTKPSSVWNARTMQRNFVSRYLNGSRGGQLKDAALVAFYAEGCGEWRFSFIRMEYAFDEEKKKITQDFTPARRSSYIVGPGEKSHTAQVQLLPILEEESVNPSLPQLEKAFSVERVTKRFFEQYRDLFFRLKDSLDDLVAADKNIRKDFEEKGVDPVDFGKKLLGQIVFLYFLQKKGWFGVERGQAWGTGPKNFLRQLFDKKLPDHKNFFNDILEPLFYDSLARDRSDDDHYYPFLKCKIPFLNGGLFDPLGNYDWIDTDITLPNDLFSNDVKTDQGDTGNGILDVFDRYNFTVKEDEPLEKEVAVDPEMLGKVFENLLEVDERSAKGTYYTPREIVHYMCEESLINYLTTELEGSVPKEDIAKLVYSGNMMIEHESRVANEGKETRDYSFKLPGSIRKHAALIDQKLEDIRVCDPAIGSGAFPVGMMSEIVSARETLSSYLPAAKNRTPYDFKRHAIQESLYGVDIDPGAVEIAKLRLWLSLIVDEDDIARIKPLPNLDYRIMQGNSLLEEFEGIRLFDEKLLENNAEDKEKELANMKDKINTLQQEYFALHSSGKLKDVRQDEIQIEIKRLQAFQKQLQAKPKQSENVSMFDSPSRAGEVLNELKILHRSFFEATQRKKKDEIKKQIESLEWELIEISLTEKKKGDLLAKLKRTRVRPFFLWKLQFADVFMDKGKRGFDIVIANPPYAGHKSGHKQFFKEMKSTSLGIRFNNERMDLFYYFFHLAIDLVREKGIVAFITTNYYVTSDSAIKLRCDFRDRASLLALINLNELKIFESALGQHNILTVLMRDKSHDPLCYTAVTKRTGLASPDLLRNILHGNDPETCYRSVPQNQLYEGNLFYISCANAGVISANQIEQILDKLRAQKTLLGHICNIGQGIVTGLDRISQKHLRKLPNANLILGQGCFVLNETERRCQSDEADEIIKPWFKNSDIQKYFTNCANSEWLIHATVNHDIKKHKAVYEHLLALREVIQLRNYDSGELSKASKLGKWWALSSARKDFDFATPKIVSPQRSYYNTFGYNEVAWYASADVYYITPKNPAVALKYVLALLNSKLYFAWLYFKGKRKGEMLELYQKPLSEIPIKVIDRNEQTTFIHLVDKILAITKDNDYLENPTKQAKVHDYEIQIDQLVYEIYGLTEEEIRTLEESVKN